MKRLPAFLPAALGLCLAAAPACARLGFIELRDGRKVDGQIRLESGRVVVVNAARGFVDRVAFTNVMGLFFESSGGVAMAVSPPGGIDRLRGSAEGKLPPGWLAQDVGLVGAPGRTVAKPEFVRVQSGGRNILGESDAFTFVYKRVDGDTEIAARVVGVGHPDPWSRAGLMIRENLSAGARAMYVGVTQARGTAALWRSEPGEPMLVALRERSSAPAWVRLKRQEDTLSAYVSSDGRQWSLLERVALPMSGPVYAGLAVTGFQEARSLRGTAAILSQATFDEVEEGPFLWSRFAPEVELRSGTVLRGYIGAADDDTVLFTGMPARASLRALHMANIRFQPVPVAALKHLRAGVPGVVLRNGDFLEGDCRGITRSRVTISSVPLGLRSYDVNSEVAAVVFRKPAEGKAAFEARTSDGARWMGHRLECGEAEVILHEPTLGRQRLSVAALTELRRRS